MHHRYPALAAIRFGLHWSSLKAYLSLSLTDVAVDYSVTSRQSHSIGVPQHHEFV